MNEIEYPILVTVNDVVGSPILERWVEEEYLGAASRLMLFSGQYAYCEIVIQHRDTKKGVFHLLSDVFDQLMTNSRLMVKLENNVEDDPELMEALLAI